MYLDKPQCRICDGYRMAKRTKQTRPPVRKRRTGVARSVSPILQGREQDIALIEHLIGRIDQGGSTLVISGEPGIGKSALLEVAKHRANECGISVLSMTGVLAEVHLPFAALEQAVRPLMKRAARLIPRQRSALLAAFGMHEDSGAPDVFLVALATLTLLTERAARKPILLVADDAQWLDQATYEVLAFISRRLSSDPIFLLVAMRDGFNRSFGDASTHRHRISGLEEADAERLMDAHAPGLSADMRSRFLEQAAGNPLALVELPHGERAADARDTPWYPLTERLERAFSSRLSDLPDTARTLLFVAAENDGTSLHEILRASEVVLSTRLGVDALAPAIAAKLIEINGTEVQFRHPLVRSAMHQAADPAMRQKIHAALAATIQDQLDRQLWHRAAATIGPDDELAGEHDRMAARALRRGAVAMAIEILENAARLSSTARAKSDRLLRAADLAADLGQRELLERLLRQADIDESDELAPVRIGWCREISQPPAVDDPAKIPALVSFAARARAAGAKDLASNLLWRAAQRCWWSNASDELRARVLVAVKQLELPETDPRLIAISAYVEPLQQGGDLYVRLKRLSELRDGDPSVARILGSTSNVIGAFDLGVGFLAESSAALRAQGRLSDLARVLFAQGWAEMEVGDWMGAIREAEESVRFAEETGEILWIAAATIVKAKLAGMQGNLEQSEAHAAEAERLVLSIGASFLLAMLQIARGISAIGAGRHWEAYEHLRRIFAPADPAFNSGLQFFGLADFVEAAVFSGNPEEARGVLNGMERVSAPMPVPWVETMLHYGKALLAAPEDAELFFLQGLGPAAKKWPFLRGRLLLAYGGWLRRQRRPADARAPLREARDIFDALGASPWSDRAREELRASGESSRRRTEQLWEDADPAGTSHRAARYRRAFEQGNRRQALSVSQNCRLSPAPYLFENRHHVAVRTTPHSCQHQPSRKLTADLSSDWSFDRSGSPSSRATRAWRATPLGENDNETIFLARSPQPRSNRYDSSCPSGPGRRHRPSDRSQIRSFLAKINKDSSPFWQLPQPKPQQILSDLQSQTAVDISGVTTTEQTINHDGRSVKLYIMKPAQISSRPGVLLFIHGGVWIVGNFENHRRLLRDLVVGSGQIGVFVEYTSLPEAKFPTQLEQCYAALQWVAQHAQEFGADGSRIAVAGNSVGGNMAAALSLMSKDRGGPKISFQALLIPATDARSIPARIANTGPAASWPARL